MRSAVVVVAVSLSLSLVLARAGHAQEGSDDNEAKAQALYAEGESAYANGNYESALASFSAAYELIPVAGLLFNIGQCYRKLGHHRKAAEFFERYLVEETDEIGNRAEVKELLLEEKKLADEERAAKLEKPVEVASKPPVKPAEPQLYEEPLLWGIAGGVALVAVVGGAVAIAIATSPPPSGSLGTFDLRTQ